MHTRRRQREQSGKERSGRRRRSRKKKTQTTRRDLNSSYHRPIVRSVLWTPFDLHTVHSEVVGIKWRGIYVESVHREPPTGRAVCIERRSSRRARFFGSFLATHIFKALRVFDRCRRLNNVHRVENASVFHRRPLRLRYRAVRLQHQFSTMYCSFVFEKYEFIALFVLLRMS
jgi:hypothetical protein